MRNALSYQLSKIAVHGDIMRELNLLLEEEGNELVCTAFWAGYSAVHPEKFHQLSLASVKLTPCLSLLQSKRS